MNRKQAQAILGIDSDYTTEELKKRYRALMLITHPDTRTEHHYPYDAGEINAAYEYLVNHSGKEKITVDKKPFDQEGDTRSNWNAQINANAYAERNIYMNVEDSNGDVIGRANVAVGKYVWTEDEDFNLFLYSLIECGKAIIARDDEAKNRDRSDDIGLHADIVYLLAGQYVDSSMVLSLLSKTEAGKDADGNANVIYSVDTMLEVSDYYLGVKKEEVLLPAGVADHKLYVKNAKGKMLGYISFRDDRLYYGIIPLFERKAVQVMIKVADPEVKRLNGRKYIDLDMKIRLLAEDKSAMLDNINHRIDELLK